MFLIVEEKLSIYFDQPWKTADSFQFNLMKKRFCLGKQIKMNVHTEQGNKSYMVQRVEAFQRKYMQIREDLQSLSQSDKSLGVFIGECLSFYLPQPLIFPYHVQHSLEFQPLIVVL